MITGCILSGQTAGLRVEQGDFLRVSNTAIGGGGLTLDGVDRSDCIFSQVAVTGTTAITIVDCPDAGILTGINAVGTSIGISITDSTVIIIGGTAAGSTAMIDLDGDDCLITGVRLLSAPGLTDGILIAGNDNIVVGNDLGDSADYSGAPLVDSGTNTRLLYPADATNGDNFSL